MRINGELIHFPNGLSREERQEYFDTIVLPRVLTYHGDITLNREILDYIINSKHKKMKALGAKNSSVRKYIPVIEYGGHTWVHRNNIEQYGEEYGLS